MTQLQRGDHVRVTHLQSDQGLNVIGPLLSNRRAGLTGVAEAWVAGQHANAWWVRHDDDAREVSVYWAAELEKLSMPAHGLDRTTSEEQGNALC